MPLAGSKDSVPCGAWGNAPPVSREVANKGAGSEASLPVTSRVLRRASKLLFPTPVLCRAKWARHDTTKGDTHTLRYASKDYRKVARQMLRHHPILLLLTLLLALDDIDTPEEAETAAPKEA